MRMTSQQYQAWLAKRGTPDQRNRSDTGTTAPESDLHDYIIDFCKKQSPPWLLFHGSMGHRTRRTLGEVDFTCILPKGIVLFVECKRKNGKLSPEQQAIKHWMNLLGHKMHIIRSEEEFVTVSLDAMKEK